MKATNQKALLTLFIAVSANAWGMGAGRGNDGSNGGGNSGGGDPVVVQPTDGYDYVDPNNLVPEKPLQLALKQYDTYKKAGKLGNSRYLSVIDFSLHADKKRFFLINMQSGAVEALLTSHGLGSDANNDGYADKFSNTNGSKMTSLGFYLTDETYDGSNGFSLRLDGLNASNSNARARAIVVHPADYVNTSHVGRSWGCPALQPSVSSRVIKSIQAGSLLFAYHKNYY